MPKIYNKIINSPTPPKNTSDIWECNGRLYLYKGGGWEALKTDSESQADWNAQPGDAGYIENKPFYSKGDIRQIAVDGEYEIIVNGLNIGDRIDISWDLTYYDGEIVRGNTSFVIEEGVYTYYEKDNFNIYVSDYGGLHIYAYAFGGGESHYGKVIVTVNNEIKTIDSKYLPNSDWNAQEGEAGYIKNKPFKFYNEDVEFSIPNNFLKAEDFTSYTDWDNNITTYTSKNEYPNGIADIFYMGRNDINLDYVLNGSFFIKPKYGSNGYVIPGLLGDIFITDKYDEDTDTIRLIITASPDEDVFAYKIYINDRFSLNVETLPETYLPQTVVKTTPQNLNSNAKNQALTNLGIDPIVWKYICNPLIIKQGQPIPDELVHYPEGGNPSLKEEYWIPAMYRIFVEDEDEAGSVASKSKTLMPEYVYSSYLVGPTLSSTYEFIEVNWHDGVFNIMTSV